MNIKESAFASILHTYKKYTVYGLSPSADKTSHRITNHMFDFGFDICGIYPKIYQHPNCKIYSTIFDVPDEHRKMINVFRRSEKIMQVVDEAIEAGGVEILWFQSGITNQEAETKAQDHGIDVVSNRCIYVEYMRSEQ